MNLVASGEVTPTARKWKPYPAYKDSGVEWLGETPTHWEVKGLKRLGALQAGAGFPDEEQGLSDEELPFFKVGDMVESADGKVLESAPNTVSRDTSRRLRAFVFPAGTIVFAKVGAALRLNRRRILSRPSCIDNNMMGFTLGQCDVGWAFYWLSGLDLGELANPGAVPSVNEGQVREIAVAVPPLPEQRAIAAFLDRETAKIDALVKKKERLVDLLQEKRAAIISQAVTKGLDPNVSMKDSGVEWLGKIPAHWEVKKLKFLTRGRLQYGANEAGLEADPDQPRFVRITDVTETGELRDDTFRSLPSEIAKPYLLTTGDLLFARSGATVGKSFMYKEPWGPCCYAGYLIRVQLKHAKVLPGFLNHFASSRSYWDWISAATIQATIQNVSAEKYANLFLGIPPAVSEQQAICNYLDRETSKIDALIAKIREGIEKLKEYRTALISAAVTGKIDVREKVASAS